MSLYEMIEEFEYEQDKERMRAFEELEEYQDDLPRDIYIRQEIFKSTSWEY